MLSLIEHRVYAGSLQGVKIPSNLAMTFGDDTGCLTVVDVVPLLLIPFGIPC